MKSPLTKAGGGGGGNPSPLTLWSFHKLGNLSIVHVPSRATGLVVYGAVGQELEHHLMFASLKVVKKSN